VGFNLDDYEPVAVRLARWLESVTHDGKYGRVITHLVHYTDDRCVFRAELYEYNPATNNEILIATGWEEETRGSSPVNRTSHLANCETSSVGRALANAGHAGSDPAKRPSREEMTKVARHNYEEPFPDHPRPPGSGSPAGASEAQLRKIHAMYTAMGITDKAAQVADAKTRVRGLTGTSFASLLKMEASKLIDALMAAQ
jgi:hypothetical protein